MEDLADFVEGLTEQLRDQLKDFFGPGGASSSISDSFFGFFHAIDWTEPWLICLLVGHVLLLLVALLTRRNSNVQFALFAFALIGVYSAETLNFYADKHWRAFAGQNYFDKHGIFTSTLWSGPLIILSLVVLVNLLVALATMMVKWKRAELKQRFRQQKKAEAEEAKKDK
eukprot:TRINITY_DN6740_c0_g1_i1.p1 TRINITY_DN6740_c0_g1~~TRINITY_DN6740_c0_g1_i1.p1  ORF type:complete len:170 (-),score=43.73 TRINITY_DN6740_c0_g1_i1:125-634(-)